MTQEEFDEWRKNKLLYGMHWQRLIDRNTSELLKYNQTAVKYINGEVPQIYASGYNSVAEQIPNSPVAGFDFELINADTVSNLVHEDGIILPPKKKVDPEKDKTWNAKLINAQLLQGILQGESIPEMAKRMQTVANSDLAGATRTARTMHTAAQNAGRQSGYNKAAEQGIVFEKTWLAAMQERTRDTHIALSGKSVAYDEKFKSPSGEELEFPGDWRAAGFEVYNCRCTMITKFKGFVSGLSIKQIQDMRENYHNMTEAEQENCIQRVGQYMVGRMKQVINNALPQIDEKLNKLERLSDDIQAKMDALEAEGKAMSKEWWSFANDADDLDKVLKKAREEHALEVESEMRKLIEEVRNCGYSKSKSQFLLKNKNDDDDKAAKEVLIECAANYPYDWLKASYEFGKISVGVDPFRGGYSDTQHFILLSGTNINYQAHPVAVHELGHRMEQVVSGITEAEKRFYERRTQGEQLVKLKDVTGRNYPDYEVTRVDNFLDPYMGKDYGDGTYELVSMGFERYYTAPKELIKDEDYARFITGVLALV